MYPCLRFGYLVSFFGNSGPGIQIQIRFIVVGLMSRVPYSLSPLEDVRAIFRPYEPILAFVNELPTSFFVQGTLYRIIRTKVNMVHFK